MGGGALLTVILAPGAEIADDAITRVLLMSYLAYALLVLGLARQPLRPPVLGALTHFVDVAAFAALIHFGAAVNGLFLTYSAFCLGVAAVRWSRQGLLWTALATLVVVAAAGASGSAPAAAAGSR